MAFRPSGSNPLADLGRQAKARGATVGREEDAAVEAGAEETATAVEAVGTGTRGTLRLRQPHQARARLYS